MSRDVARGPDGAVRVVLRRLVELVGEDDAAERDRRDNCEEDPVHGELAPGSWAVAPADHSRGWSSPIATKSDHRRPAALGIVLDLLTMRAWRPTDGGTSLRLISCKLSTLPCTWEPTIPSGRGPRCSRNQRKTRPRKRPGRAWSPRSGHGHQVGRQQRSAAGLPGGASERSAGRLS